MTRLTAHSLDHLAIAVRDWAQASALAERYGGTWLYGTRSVPAFSPAQVLFANDMRIELMEQTSEPGSFVRRFLDERGDRARPHHITFKVADIHRSIDALRAAGFEPILISTARPEWKEAFVHPAETQLGFLTQIVEATRTTAELIRSFGSRYEGAPWPDPDLPRPAAALSCLFGSVGDFGAMRALLCDALGGEASGVGEDAVRLRWAQGAELALTQARDTADRGIHTILFEGPELSGPGATERRAAAGRSRWEQGLGLHVASAADR